MKDNVIVILGFVTLFSLCMAGYNRQQLNIAEVQLEENRMTIEGLMNGIEQLKLDTTGNGVKVNALTLSLNEYKKMRDDDAKLIRELKLKLKDVTSVSKQQVSVSAPIVSKITDTIVVRESVEDTIRHVSVHNKHLTFDGEIINDSIKASVNIPIKLFQVVYKIPKRKFLWWSWGCKGFRQVITTDNPYAKITYSEYINVR